LSDGHIIARPVNLVFAICLVFSVGLHIVSVLFVAFIWTAPAGVAGVDYLEMQDLVTVSPKSLPEVRSARSSKPIIPEQSPAPPNPESEKSTEPEQSEPDDLPKQKFQETSLGLGMSYGFVSSLGDGATLREDIRAYYLLLVERINKVWWERAGSVSDAIRQDGIAVVVVRSDGTLVGRQIQRGTGSLEADQALLESIDKAAPMPPLPSSFGRDMFTAPLRIKAPLQLFRGAH
jgi:hypothetical protein